MSEASIIEERLLSALRQSGLRITLARRAICKVLAEADEEFLSAPELGKRLAQQTGSGVDSSTIYRALDELSSLGLIHYVNLGSQTGTWHVTLDRDHQHLVCEICERTITMPLAPFRPALDMMRDEYGFQPSMHHFAILGVCENCAKDRASRHDEST